MDRMTWDLATLQYYCWAGRAGWEADSDYAVDRMGRLGLRRRPARPTRATPSLRHRHATADVADLVVWLVKYYSGGACTSESTGVMSRLAEAVPGRSRSRNFTVYVICNGTILLIQPPTHVP